MTRPLGDRIQTQADCMKEAVNLLSRARNLVPRTLLVAGSEEALAGSDDDCDALLKKWTDARDRIWAHLEEIADEELETADRYVLVGR